MLGTNLGKNVSLANLYSIVNVMASAIFSAVSVTVEGLWDQGTVGGLARHPMRRRVRSWCASKVWFAQ